MVLALGPSTIPLTCGVPKARQARPGGTFDPIHLWPSTQMARKVVCVKRTDDKWKTSFHLPPPPNLKPHLLSSGHCK